jgi:hypothetical protein
MRVRFLSFAALLVALTAAVTFSVSTVEAQQNRRDGTQFRGTVVRIGNTGNSFIVRTDGGKEVTFYGGDRSAYRYRNREVRFQDLRQGMVVSGYYDVTGERNVIRDVDFFDGEAPREGAPPSREPADGGTARGQILKAASDPNHLVIRAADGKEMILHLDSKREANFTFEMREGKRILTGLSFAAAPREEPERRSDSGPIRGEILRTEGTDRIIVRTTDGKEVIVYTDPKSTYEYDGKAVKFSDFKSGIYVDVDYDLRDRRPYARRIIGRNRR